MKICLLYSKEDFSIPQKCGFLRGVFLERNLPFGQADVLVISERIATAEASPAICDEAKKMGSRGIFIDSEKAPEKELILSLSKIGLDVFMPFSKALCNGAIPVIETVVSGGSLTEYLDSAGATFPRFAVSVRRAAYELALPMGGQNTNELTQRELRSLISLHEPDIFFSPQLMCKYFLMNTEKEAVSLVLFDDAETISGKLRLAKKHGASHAFLVCNEISDIFDKIVF